MHISVFGRTFFIPLSPISAACLQDPLCLPALNLRMRSAVVSLTIPTVKTRPPRLPSLSRPPQACAHSAGCRFSPKDGAATSLLANRHSRQCGTTALHTHARPELNLALTRPSDVGETCSAVVWDEVPTSDIGSHVEPMFETTGGEGTFSSSTSTGKQRRPSCVLAHCLPRGRRYVSNGRLPTPPGTLNRGIEFCLDTRGGRSIFLKFR